MPNIMKTIIPRRTDMENTMYPKTTDTMIATGSVAQYDQWALSISIAVV